LLGWPTPYAGRLPKTADAPAANPIFSLETP
jgi:hypothetical protein